MRQRGATLIELVVTITIVAIMAAVSAGIIVYLLQIFVYLPQEMKARTIAQEVLATIIEGEPGKQQGLRYAAGILTVTRTAATDRILYSAGYPGAADRQRVQLRWARRGTTGPARYEGTILRRVSPLGSTTLGGEETVPYYAGGGTWVRGNPANPPTVFRYYKANGDEIASGATNLSAADRAAIRRIDINIAVKAGSGLFQSWGATYTTSSSVEIQQYP